MRATPAQRKAGGEEGFTLIELLVVILIIGILAAIAIPSFLNQTGKAADASAKETARSAALAAETYATEHGGYYGGITEPKQLHELEPAIQLTSGHNTAYLSVAQEQESGKGFIVTAIAPGGDTFSVTRTQNGEVKRTCKAATSNTGGCATGDW